jgi:hypothetical protein
MSCPKRKWQIIINEISLKVKIDYGSLYALMHLSHQLVDHDYEIFIYIFILQCLYYVLNHKLHDSFLE